MSIRDGYSNFGFFNAMSPITLTDATAETGYTVDTKGYETATMVVYVGSCTSAGAFGAANFWQLMLEHYNSTAAAWSECYPSQMIHSVVGQNGAYSGLDSGIFQSLVEVTARSTIYAVGYKGPHRFIRLRISCEGAPSLFSVAAICVCGNPANWPVNTPV
jgi:hypothetical protein